MSQALYTEFKNLQNRNMVESAPDSMLSEMYAEIQQLPAEEKTSDPHAIDVLISEEWERRLRWKVLQKAEPQVENPEITVKSDFDGYFEKLVRGWVKQLRDEDKRLRHKRIVIEAGAYRSSAVATKSDGIDTLSLDFYSAIRNGFGGLSDADVAAIKNNWL